MTDPWQHWHKQRRSSTWREWREPYQPWRAASWLEVAIIALLAIALSVKWFV